MSDPSHLYLRRRLSILRDQTATLVARRRADDPDPNDRFRGLYIPDHEVDRLLTEPDDDLDRQLPPEIADTVKTLEELSAAAEAQGMDIRFRRLGRSFSLDPLDLELLLIAVAPDLDSRFERLYAYLNDDVSRRRATIGLALELCGADPLAANARCRLSGAGRLVKHRLLIVEEQERPFLTRSLRVPDRVTLHLLGHDSPDPLVAALLTNGKHFPLAGLPALKRSLESGHCLFYVKEGPGAAGRAAALSTFSELGKPAIVLDLKRVDSTSPVLDLAACAVREARLRGVGLVISSFEAVPDTVPSLVRLVSEEHWPVVFVGTKPWNPQWTDELPLTLEAPVPSASERAHMWQAGFGGALPSEFDPNSATSQFRLAPDQILSAAQAAKLQAAADARPVTIQDLHSGSRRQNAPTLERLARRVEPQANWDDLVLPGPVLFQLKEVANRARYRSLVLDEWRMGSGSSKGRGVTALFAGDSGTGKTMSAEILAHDLGLDLYVIDLSSIVSKYIGETEKNLSELFDEAQSLNCVLLFDEADVLFGKRSEVKDSHDRYANVEVAFLLQRLELFDGLAVLTTNLRSNVDEAFTRRFDSIVDFPLPEEEDRHRLWAINLKPEVPKGTDVDVSFLASAFKLSGGNIRNIAVSAAYFAAAAGRPVAMMDLVRATEREYRKLGRLCIEPEFGDYYPLISETSAEIPPRVLGEPMTPG